MNTQYRKNLKAVLEASKSYCDESIANLEWQIGTYNYDVATDSNVARIKTLPSDTYKSQIDYIGGKTVKYNQLVQNSNFESDSNWSNINCSFSVANNIATFTATAKNGNINQYVASYVDNHKYLALARCKLTTATTAIRLFGNGGYLSVYTTATTDWQTLSKIFTGISSEDRAFNIRDTRDSGWDAIQVKYLILIDLTDKFGAGNEPSTVETAIPLLKANGYKLDGTDTYSVGELKHAIVSGVKYEAVNLLALQDKASTTTSGITYKIENDLVSINGTVNSGTYPQLYGTDGLMVYLEAGTYTISKTIQNIGLYMWLGYGGGYNNVVNNNTPSVTFTINESGYYKFNLVGVATYSFTNYTTRVVINRGSTALPYTPYTQPKAISIPSEVLADVRYGLGYDNTNYNHLDIDGHLRGGRNRVKLKDLTFQKYTHATFGDYFLAVVETLGIKREGTFNVTAYSFQNAYYTSVARNSNVFVDMTICADGDANSVLQIQIKDSRFADATSFKNHFTDDDYLEYPLAQDFDQDYSQYFDTNWNKVDLDKQYATCEMVVVEPIDMPNSITNLIKEVKA